MISLLERNLWLSVVLLAALVVLVFAAVFNLGSGVPRLEALPEGDAPRWEQLERERLSAWFTLSNVTRLFALTNGVNPFFTDYFKPPAPAKTKNVEVSYLGHYISSRGIWRAFVQLGDKTHVLTNGSVLVADYAVHDILASSLILTNKVGKTNQVRFSKKAVLSVPIK